MTFFQLLLASGLMLVIVVTFLYFMWNRHKYLKPETVFKKEVMERINQCSETEVDRIMTALSNGHFSDDIGGGNGK